MEKTKYQYLQESDQEKGYPQPSLELGYPSDGVLVDLPQPDISLGENMSFGTVVEKRRTNRKYTAEKLSLDELSYLLWVTQGVKKITTRPVTLRLVPSAGARHAFETYLFINKVEGLEPGLYRYIATEHKLLVVDLDPDFGSKLSDSARQQIFINNSAVTFIWSAVMERMKWRYGERSFRYIHLDAGHVCQNLYLAAETIKAGVCAIAAFDDDQINQLLNLDGDSQFVVYLASLGKLD